MEPKYTVRQAEEMTGVKSYVLRYWEDELDLRIGRNELGHRYYTRVVQEYQRTEEKGTAASRDQRTDSPDFPYSSGFFRK